MSSNENLVISETDFELVCASLCTVVKLIDPFFSHKNYMVKKL